MSTWQKTLSSSRQHQLLTPYTTIQLNNRLPKKISQLANNSTSLFFYSSKARRFIPYSQEPKPEYRSRCSCKTIGWTVRVSYPGRGESFFPSPKRPIQLVPVFPTGGNKRPGREVDQSPPSIAEVKNVWSYTSTSPLWLHGVVRDILTYICPPMDSFSRYEILRAVSLSI